MSSWRRTYWTVWLSNLVTSIGMMSFLPFFPSLLEEMGVEDEALKRTWAGLIFAGAPLSATLMSPIWGALGDRFGRKLMVCRSMLAITIFVGGMYFVDSPAALFAMRLGQGLFSGFIPPSITLVSVSAPPERQGRVAGDLTTALALGGILGPMLGGWIAAATAEHRTVFLFVAAASLASALLVALFAEEDRSKRQVSEGPVSIGNALRGTAKDIAAVFANPTMRGAAGLIFALQFGLGAINPVLELHVRELLAGPRLEGWSWIARFVPAIEPGNRASIETFATSLLFGGMAIVNLISLPVWGRYGDRVGHRPALLLCAIGSVISLGFQAAATLFGALLLARLAMGVALAGTGPLAFGLAAAEVSADRRGGAFGVVFSARTFAVAVGGATGGALSAVIGVRGLMVLAALLLLVALEGFRRSSRST